MPVAQLWAPPRPRDAVQVVRARRRPDRGRDTARPARAAGRAGRTASLREWTGRSRRWPADAQDAAGEVLIYVARGALEVDLDGTVHALDEGDTLRFDGAIPHRLRRRGGPGTRALIVATRLSRSR